MSFLRREQARIQRKTFRVRNAYSNKNNRLRVTVFRSLKNISAQIIDDAKGHTIVSFSSLSIEQKIGNKKDVAKFVGIELGKKAREKGIEKVYFDRGSYMYFGRVAQLADGLRESGLQF
jgi:large subunit ribosomal protein L18